jgi:septal ring factor EnvC (AmiA/AmiB activator)
MGATPTGDASVLWRAGKSSLERTAVYIRAIRKFDESNFKEVRTAFETVSAKQDELADSIAKERAAQDELRSKREEGEGESSKLKAVMDQINAKKKSAEKALAKLRAEADKLEEVMASLTRGEIPPEEIRPSPQPEETRAAVNVEQPDVGPLRGLFERGVQLVAPVKGSVVQKFGNVRVTNFSDMIFSKGLEFATESDSDVHAIASGKVAYVGNMPGYETVVVLDHGARSYSLYGRLGKALVTSGQLIQKDSVVGSTSAPDDKGRNFYFEVRKNGSPVDPEGVLKRTSR